METLPVPRNPKPLRHPPSTPSGQAKRNVREPGRVQQIGEDLVLPPTHVRDDADERGYVGSFMPERDAAESQSHYIRLPNALMHLIYEIVNDPREPYGGVMAAFIRHAVYELLFVHYLRRIGEKGVPEIVQYLKSQALLRRRAFETMAEQQGEEAMHGIEQFLARAIENGMVMDIHRHLADIDDLYRNSTSDTWKLQFQGLLARSAVIERAIDCLTREWTDSEDVWKRKQVDRWLAWRDSLREQ